MTRGFQAIKMLSNSYIPMERRRVRRSWGYGRESPETKVAATVDWAKSIGLVADGDREAYVRLFEHFAPRIKGLMLKTGASSHDADEIAQEAMLTVWRKAGHFDPASAGASAWIYTIARNLRIDAGRRLKRTGAVDYAAELDYLVDPSELPDEAIARMESIDRIEIALSRLSGEQSMAIRLSFIEERPHSEIGRLLGIPLGTVKSRIRLAMNRLKALLDETR